MRIHEVQAAIGTAVLLLSTASDARLGHRMSHLDAFEKKHHHHRSLHNEVRAEGNESTLEKRATCDFPSGAGLVSVTPGSMNGGWALSPDQACTAGSFCPYACPPGQVMAQWDPLAIAYTYPMSMVRLVNSPTIKYANIARMVDCTAITVAKLASHSLTSHIVFQESGQSQL